MDSNLLKNEAYTKVLTEDTVFFMNAFLQRYSFPIPIFNEDSLRILEKRYLIKDKNTGLVLEDVGHFVTRVAAGVVQNNKFEKEEELDIILRKMSDYINLMSSLDFLPNSPTLMNAGKLDGNLSACYVVPIEDSLDKIFDAVKDVALIHKAGGGTGMDFSKLRPANDMVKTTMGVSSGPISFMKIFDAATEQVKQGGTRRGANMGILRIDSPDIEEFITCKKDKNQLNNFNISVAITDKFMQAVEKDETFELIHPNTKKVVKEVEAKRLWDMLVENAWESGDPGIVFIDKINSDSTLIGPNHKISATNPCGEQPLEPYEACITKDGLILTIDGVKKIGSLVGKDTLVYSPDGRFHKYEKVVSRGEKKVFEIQLEDGRKVKATADHKFLINDSYVEVSDISIGDEMSVLRTHPLPMIDDIDEEYEMYGWIHGDGWYSSTLGISFNNKDGDFEVKERLLPVFRKVFSAENLKPMYDNDVSFQLQTEKQSALDICKNLGFSKGRAYEWKLPTTFYQWTLRQQVSFMRGLFTADGSVSGKQKTQIFFNSTSADLINEVQEFLVSTGIQCRTYTTIFSSVNRKPQYKLVISKESAFRFMNLIGFSCSKKINQFNFNMHQNYKDNSILSVISVEEIGEEEVFDIVEVENANTFYVNGIATHNCNLGSINLKNFIKKGNGSHIDFDRLGEVVLMSIQFLDDVVDACVFPLPEINDKVKANRKIGLGVMGFADVLAEAGIRYGSQESYSLAEQIMEFIEETAISASEMLAEVYGVFPTYEDSTWKQDGIKVRNATLTTIAPTGSISMIANGTSSGVEPLFALSYKKTVMDGAEFVYIHPIVERLIANKEITPDDERYILETGAAPFHLLEKYPYLATAQNGISPSEHVKMQATFQRYVDNAVSKTVNLPNSATKEDISMVYLLSYTTGCKGVTVFRDGCKGEQVLTTGTSGQKIIEEPVIVHPKVKERPEVLDAKAVKIKTGCGNLYVNLSTDSDGNLQEMFCHLGKSGGCASSQVESVGRLVSKWFRAGLEPREMAEQLRGISCGKPAFVEGGRVLSCSDAMGIVIEKYLDGAYNTEHVCQCDGGCPAQQEVKEEKKPYYISKVERAGMGACSECGGPVEYEGGCEVCRVCAASKCG